MYLIKVDTMCLVDFSSRERPRYAILSHRWTENETTFEDIGAADFRLSSCSTKFQGMLQQAKHDNIEYVWIDTCCIDRKSSAELSEAINSMYQWYQGAEVCYVHLHDVNKENWQNTFSKSEWFKRGWTLQELLAPQTVVFFDHDWWKLGEKESLAEDISRITGITIEALRTGKLQRYSIAQKMAWAAERVTTRPEDCAYALIGLFGVNMPLLYGEGERAFQRLQEEVIQRNDDHSIFAWSMDEKTMSSGLLAPVPACFIGIQSIVSRSWTERSEAFAMTNRGLSLKLEVTPWMTDTYLAFLNCAVGKRADKKRVRNGGRVGIFLRRLGEDDQYVRITVNGKSLWFDRYNHHFWQYRPIRARQLFVRRVPQSQLHKDYLKDRIYGFKINAGCQVQSSSMEGKHNQIEQDVVTLRPGEWGPVAVFNVLTPHEGTCKVALGFDFEFNPVCLIENSILEIQQTKADPEYLYNWGNALGDLAQWDDIIAGGTSYRQVTHGGVWALKGHRLRGLDVVLSLSGKRGGTHVAIKRNKNARTLLWRFVFESLTDPFEQYYHSKKAITPASVSCGETPEAESLDPAEEERLPPDARRTQSSFTRSSL